MSLKESNDHLGHNLTGDVFPGRSGPVAAVLPADLGSVCGPVGGRRICHSVLEAADRDTALAVAERISNRLAGPLYHPRGQHFDAVCQQWYRFSYTPDIAQAEDTTPLLENADIAMYRAKGVRGQERGSRCG